MDIISHSYLVNSIFLFNYIFILFYLKILHIMYRHQNAKYSIWIGIGYNILKSIKVVCCYRQQNLLIFSICPNLFMAVLLSEYIMQYIVFGLFEYYSFKQNSFNRYKH